MLEEVGISRIHSLCGAWTEQCKDRRCGSSLAQLLATLLYANASLSSTLQ